MLMLTVLSINATDITLVSTPTDLGTDWSAFVDLRYCDYSKVATGDVLTISYTAQDGAQIQLQSNWAEYKTYNELDAAGTLSLVIDEDLMTRLNARDEGMVIKGQNATITSVVIKKATTGIDAIQNSKFTMQNSQSNINGSVIYNLAGQRVGSNYRGIVIVNGKKLLLK